MNQSSSAARAGFVRGLIGGVAVMAALALAAGRSSPVGPIAPTPLWATATDSDQGYAVATGLIEEEEGLFLLNPHTGVLQCWVVNKRVPNAATAFIYPKVHEDVGAPDKKEPRYLLVTGVMDFGGVAGPAKPGRSIVYVVNGANGRFAAYAPALTAKARLAPGPHAMRRIYSGKALEPPQRETAE